MNFIELKDLYTSTIHIPDGDLLWIIFATIISNRQPGKPLWLIITGPSGSGKSLVLESIKGREIVFCETITSHALISDFQAARGQKKREASLLPLLHNKTFILADLSTVLSLPREEQEQIWGQLREAYKGTYDRHSGVRRVHFDCHFGLITATVTMLEHERALRSALGERFYYYAIKYDENDRKEAANNVKRFWNKEDRRYNALCQASRSFLDNFKINPAIDLDENEKNWVTDIAALVAKFRSPVAREFYRRWVEEEPSVEVPSRLSMQFMKFAWGLKQLGIDDFRRVIAKLAFSSVPSLKLSVISHCLQFGSLTQKEWYEHTNISHQRASEIFHDLCLLKVLKKSKQQNRTLYTLENKCYEDIKRMKIAYDMIRWVEK